MRPIIEDPLADDPNLNDVLALAKDIFILHERGESYLSRLVLLSTLLGRTIDRDHIEGAFGCGNYETFALGLLLSSKPIPHDLVYDELLELVSRVYRAEGSKHLATYWIDCLRVNTGDDRIFELLFYPGDYFGDGNNQREMTPREILDAALESGKGRGRVLLTAD